MVLQEWSESPGCSAPSEEALGTKSCQLGDLSVDECQELMAHMLQRALQEELQIWN